MPPWRKLAAWAFLLLGIGFFLVLAVGEMAAGEISGVQHVVPVAVLSLLIWLSARHPEAAGIVLLAFAGMIGILSIVFVILQDLSAAAGTVLLVVVPAAVTGSLLLRSPRTSPRR